MTMHKHLSILAAAALFAASASAQCLNTTGGTAVTLTPTFTWPAHDEGRSAPMPLGFAFPIAGAVAATYDSVVVDANGVLWLTNGAAAPVGMTDFGAQDMAGFVGDSPRIAAFWDDLEGANGSWSVTMDTSIPGECTINWIDINEYFQPGTFSVQVKLFATGEVAFTFSTAISIVSSPVTVGVSAGNGVTGSSMDLTTMPSSSVPSLYEEFGAGAMDVSGNTITMVPNGTGFLAVMTCGNPPAYHQAYGTGCYDVPGTGFYELHADASVASPALTGNSLMMIPTGSGYTGLWTVGGAASFIAPTGSATLLGIGDDASLPITLPSVMPSPNGPVSTITVSGNGIITLGSVSNNDFDYSPSGPEFAAETGVAFYAWHDYNESEVGSGQIKSELVGNTFCITWDGVENYSATPMANPSTMQFQLDLTTGMVTVMWTSVDTDTSTTFGTGHLVGWRANGVIADNGSQVFASTLPATSQSEQVSMVLSASPAPISTATSGTTVIYQTDNIPEFAPGAGVYIAINILSLGEIPAPGVDLGFIGAPGCAALVASLDVIQNMVGVTSSQSVTLPIPAGVPVGTTVYSQSASLIQPNSLPNGQNAFGLTTSNAIKTFISSQ